MFMQVFFLARNHVIHANPSFESDFYGDEKK